MRSSMFFSSYRHALGFKAVQVVCVVASISTFMPSSYAQHAKHKPVVNVAAPVSAPTSQKEKPIDGIVAVVNSDVVTRREIETRLVQLKKQLTAQGIALPPDDQLRRQLLDRIILEDAQLQLAKESGITVDDDMVDRAIGQIAAQNQLTVPVFKERLTQEGLDYTQFREDIRRQILMQRVRERNVTRNVNVSDSEIDNFLRAQGAADTQGLQLHLAHILIAVPENASVSQIEERRQRAQEILKRLQNGEDFAKTAATYSDSSDALNGGDLGMRDVSRLPQIFIDAGANLQPGQISGVVKSANGFHILKLLERKSANNNNSQAMPALEETHARHILIKVNKLVSADQAKQQLINIKRRIDNHAATFEDMAKQYSQDGSAAQGGDLGWINPGDTVPAFENAMNQLKPGEISEPVETPFGYHLIQVLERRVDTASDDKKRQAIKRAIQDRKTDEATEAWLRELRDSTYVEIRDPDYQINAK